MNLLLPHLGKSALVLFRAGIVIAICCHGVHAQSIFYTGSIYLSGKGEGSPIQMSVTRHGDSVIGSYWYTHFGEDIPIKGQYTSPNTLELTAFPDDTTREEFSLRSVSMADRGHHVDILDLDGTWKSGKRSRNCEFYQRAISLPPGVKVLEEAKHVGPSKGNRLSRFPRIVNPSGSQSIAKIELLSNQWIDALLDSAKGPKDQEYSVVTDLEFANSDIMSFGFSTIWNFEGARHTYYRETSLNFDMHTGEVMGLADLFTSPNAVLEVMNTRDSIALYDSLHLDHKDYKFSSRLEKDIPWVVTPKGIVILHDARGDVPDCCFDFETLVPFKLLRPFFREHSPLNTLTDKP